MIKWIQFPPKRCKESGSRRANHTKQNAKHNTLETSIVFITHSFLPWSGLLPARPGRFSDTMGQLVLIDTGCSIEVRTFPESWKGKLPKGAELCTMNLAVGKYTGCTYKDVVYAPPEAGEIEPTFAWGKCSSNWGLSGDFSYHSKDPTCSTASRASSSRSFGRTTAHTCTRSRWTAAECSYTSSQPTQCHGCYPKLGE